MQGKTVHIPEELHRAAKIEATKQGSNIEAIVALALKEYLTKRKKKR